MPANSRRLRANSSHSSVRRIRPWQGRTRRIS
ncbi:hypothetical protein HNQ66_002944 [Shinella fusca]|uniref:Uncharacterized protein n=1 Tax=Shinella fusca TaxID=544480 RepID=A0A7W7YW86_9HYPH|nr:hypothetical protein [Shinella fusca]